MVWNIGSFNSLESNAIYRIFWNDVNTNMLSKCQSIIQAVIQAIIQADVHSNVPLIYDIVHNMTQKYQNL
jgi:hypothetical protein